MPRESYIKVAPYNRGCTVILKFKVSGPIVASFGKQPTAQDCVFTWSLACKVMRHGREDVESAWTAPFKFMDLYSPKFPEHAEDDLLEQMAEHCDVKVSAIRKSGQGSLDAWCKYMSWISHHGVSPEDIGFGPDAYYVLSQLKSLAHDLSCVMVDEQIGHSGGAEKGRWEAACKVLGAGLSEDECCAVSDALDELSLNLPEYYDKGMAQLKEYNAEWMSRPDVAKFIHQFKTELVGERPRPK